MAKLINSKKYVIFLFVTVVSFYLSCDDGRIVCDQPAESKTWLGRGGGFKEWGPSPSGVWGLSLEPEILEVWQWNKNTMEKQYEIILPRPTLDIACLEANKYAAAIRPPDADDWTPWPLLLIDAKTNTQLRRWGDPPGYNYSETGASSNGKYLAVIAHEDVDHPNHVFPIERCRIDLIDVEKMNLIEVITLSNKNYKGFLGRPIATNDGKYIAVPGWLNGVAMIDVANQKVLWSKKPFEASSLNKAVFSNDNNSIYVGGGCGYMYEMEVSTGKILSQWFANDTQEEMYGHHVTCIDASSDGQYVASGTGPIGELYIWSKRTKKIKKLVHGGGTIDLVSFSPDSMNLASFVPGSINIWPRNDWANPQHDNESLR